MITWCFRKSRKCVCLTSFLMIVAMVFTGCGADNNETGNAKAEDSQEQKTGLFPEEAGTVWSDSWGTKTADGKELNVTTNARISVLDTEKMSVAEVREFVFDGGSKKQVAEGIFGNEVYSYETEKLPKDLLEKELEEAQKRLDSAAKAKEESKGSDNDSGASDLYKAEQQEVKYLTKLLKNAKDEFILASEDDYKANQLIGERDGIQYKLVFEEEQFNFARPRGIRFSPYDPGEVCPEELKGMDSLSWAGMEESIDDNDPSMEKAKKTAEEFLVKTGFSDMICRKSQALIWMADPPGDSGNGEKKEVQYGYTFSFGPGIGGNAFIDSGVESVNYSDYTDFIKENGGYLNYPLGSEIQVDVTEKGVVSAYWNSPVQMMSVTEDVKLLSLPDIQKIMKESVGKCIGDDYGVAKTHLSLNRLELVYFRLKDRSRKGYYSYVPVWRLSEDSDYCRCMINAIDGTVIDVKDQLTMDQNEEK